ncbi:hypothetical protein [Stenotrophomonas maltophilia]|uniref:hypothetical protein n=1 Tax=Stenotrophomonas maltophilia TaxID=40324 RepID=UPI002E7A25CC|nr:hypothetical protein [Stenotrophomonas maltophilia]
MTILDRSRPDSGMSEKYDNSTSCGDRVAHHTTIILDALSQNLASVWRILPTHGFSKSFHLKNFIQDSLHFCSRGIYK